MFWERGCISFIMMSSKQNTVPIYILIEKKNINGDDNNYTVQWMAECQKWNCCFDRKQCWSDTHEQTGQGMGRLH